MAVADPRRISELLTGACNDATDQIHSTTHFFGETEEMKPDDVGPLLADFRQCLRILEWLLLLFLAAQAAASKAEGQQASIPIYSLLMQINADAVCLVRTQFQHIMAIVVFSLVALLHLLRVALGWEVTVDGIFIPFWASVIACVVAVTLAFMLWCETRT